MKMSPQAQCADALLRGNRVLDMAGEPAMITGRVLADMGADVIKVERPGGDPARDVGPFWHDIPDREKSLYWFAYNAGKRGITLNLKSEDGRALLRTLVQSADFLIETSTPGQLASLGLDYQALRTINPRLIHITVTPFGSTGPYAHYRGSDIVNMAMGGFMHIHGDADRRPISFSFPQAFLHSGAEAAAASMIAHRRREQTGLGQHVDVSVQEAVQWTLQNAAWFWDLNQVNLGRGGAVKARSDGVMIRSVWPCKHGFMMFPGGRMYGRMADWMKQEGLLDETLLERDFSHLDAQHSPGEEIDELMPSLNRFFQSRSSWEGYEGAVKNRVMMMPISTIKDVVEYRQLAERNYFESVVHDELESILKYPGAFLRTTTLQPNIRGRAPLIGEHNRELLTGELGLSPMELTALETHRVI